MRPRSTDAFSRQSESREFPEDRPTNPSTEATLGDLINRRFSRRDLLKGALGVSALGALAASPLAALARAAESRAAESGGAVPAAAESAGSRFAFAEIAHGVDLDHHVSPGYRADVLLRWGDPVLAGAPAFDARGQSAAAQAGQFGYNNDFVGYLPLPFGSDDAGHGLLCVNHEYTTAALMFPEGTDEAERVAIEMAAHGGSIVEIERRDGRWRVVPGSRYARRLTAGDTAMRLSGPAAGHARLCTAADPSGRRVIGTLNNCAGGITPWGTWLMAEENFDKYFEGALGEMPEAQAEAGNHRRLGLPGKAYAWGRVDPRFDLAQAPREPNRFGWIVEVDPFDPASVPVKRTALGRFKHEGAEGIVNADGRYVVYSGDDQRFEFLYKFVTAGRVNRTDRAANRDLLDHGVLYVARFHDDGGLTWLPLVHGVGPLTEANGFADQAEVLIETRRAATALGATPLDRPEDVEPNPVNGKVYVMLTNNSKRTEYQLDGVNARAGNLWGQIVEIAPADGDHAALTGTWDVLVRAGDPADPGARAMWNPATSEHGWFACPDNCAIDPDGRLWVSTDQGKGWKTASGGADGLWALDTDGDARGTGRMFYRVPVGAELCGPRFTPDGRTLFVAVQHPGGDGTSDFPGFERVSTFTDPATRWPDFDPAMPPRPAVVVITREDGGLISA